MTAPHIPSLELERIQAPSPPAGLTHPDWERTHVSGGQIPGIRAPLTPYFLPAEPGFEAMDRSALEADVKLPPRGGSEPGAGASLRQRLACSSF